MEHFKGGFPWVGYDLAHKLVKLERLAGDKLASLLIKFVS